MECARCLCRISDGNHIRSGVHPLFASTTQTKRIIIRNAFTCEIMFAAAAKATELWIDAILVQREMASTRNPKRKTQLTHGGYVCLLVDYKTHVVVVSSRATATLCVITCLALANAWRKFTCANNGMVCLGKCSGCGVYTRFGVSSTISA